MRAAATGTRRRRAVRLFQPLAQVLGDEDVVTEVRVGAPDAADLLRLAGRKRLGGIEAEVVCKKLLAVEHLEDAGNAAAEAVGGVEERGVGIGELGAESEEARGHLAALRFLPKSRSITCNLGTGRGHSVLEMVKAFERASGRKVPLEFAGRRPGDVAQSFADPSLAAKALGWKAELGIDAMCRDVWRWQSQNPNGY